MSWFDRTNKTNRIGKLEIAVARLTGMVGQIKADTTEIRADVKAVCECLNRDHIEHAQCEAVQDGRWGGHKEEHERLNRDMEKITKLLADLDQNVRFASSAVSRLADRQRDRSS